MINRRIGPGIKDIVNLHIPTLEMYELANGVKVCEINIGSQEIFKLDIIHKAGRSIEDNHLVARAVSSLIKDGCRNKNSSQIAEEIDFYGSSIKTASNMDFSYTTFYTLSKHFEKAISLVHDIYYTPVFPEDEIEKFKHLNIQKLKEELSKNDVITYRSITEEIFGSSHPYGYNSVESDYKLLNRNNIYNHYNDFYGSDNCFIFLSGKINDQIREAVSVQFGTEIKHSKKKPLNFEGLPVHEKKIQLTSKNEHQSAIKIGRKLFNKSHADNVVFFLLNTIFGGYFGSRLMKSIREDKGYTYDISSSIDQMLYDGCFYVSTEAANEYVDPIIKEVYHQMNLLQNTKVGSKELVMVKNYLMGTFMNMLDGPMNVSAFAKSMIMIGKQPADFIDFVNEMMEITEDNLINTAQTYFNEKDMIEIVVSSD